MLSRLTPLELSDLTDMSALTECYLRTAKVHSSSSSSLDQVVCNATRLTFSFLFLFSVADMEGALQWFTATKWRVPLISPVLFLVKLKNKMASLSHTLNM